nr:uncharacterized protein CFP56_55712 [Quercus suber]
MALIEEELGQPWNNVYSELSSSPIAAASLGQVYKGRLKENGDLVAVKVQRPFVLETVTVDLYVIRNLGLVLRKFPQISVDVVGLVDEWAARFFEELDYVNEGENGKLFAEMMKKDLPQVVVPKTYQKYTSRKVLTTGWVEGEKLSQSKESDVGELVNVGVICYLKQVPSFPDDVAMALIEEELGQPWNNVYSELSSSPIAAASLGQVYKGRLKENGDLVAVKVQRPFVLETVTVDLYVIRNLGLVLRKFPQISVDVVGLVDEWAARFFEELDYVNEGENGKLFAEMMKKDLPQVVVPKTYQKYTSRKVLTTGWVEGEKLSQSKESDVGELVNVGVICYLKQLLDTGFFHADPHPGNLIRTPDGKLAILDFGLVTKLTDDQKYGMIEAIAHLIHRDYGSIVKDFVKLGFIPEGVNLDPIMPVLAKVFDQALEGGGAKNINFQELASDLAQITFDYPFRIPPYFALIIRAIGVLEGIALVGNSDFAIVDEAYPYIAQRLLTDESPRLRNALRYTIYGKSGVFDAERFIDVMQAFENFITAAKSGGGESLNGDMAELGILQSQTGYIIPGLSSTVSQPQQPIQTRAALAFLLSDKGNFFREFLLDEIVKGIDAVTRDQLVQILSVLGIRNAVPVFSLVPAFGPFKPAALVPTINDEDKVILNNVQKVVEFLTTGSAISRTSNQDVNIEQVIQELLPVLPGISTKVLPEVLSRLSSRVLARTNAPRLL